MTDIEIKNLQIAADKFIDNKRDELSEYLAALVRLPSINQGDPDTCDERPVADFVANTFREMGLETEVVYGDNKRIRPNVFGTLKGSGGGKSILFNAHMDVVPEGDVSKWTYPPFSGTIADGRVWGRGARDDKNGIASMIYALKAVQSTGAKLKGDVILMPSAGEESDEGGVYGAGKAIELSGKTADFAIIAEESNLDIYNASSSLCFFEIVVPGKGIHISERNKCIYPQAAHIETGSAVGVDALDKARPIIDMIYRKEQDWNVNTMRSKLVGSGGLTGSDNCGVGVFTISPVAIHGETYLGSLIEELRVTFGVWHDPKLTMEDIKTEIERDVAAVASTDSWLREHPPVINMPIIQTWPGFETDPEHPGIKMMQDICEQQRGVRPIITGERAVTDASFITMQGIPSIIIGPGGTDSNCHGIDENVRIDELVACTKIYAHAMIEWCSRNR